MGLFRKKEEKKLELPEFPQLPELPPMPESPLFKQSAVSKENEINNLPSFPKSLSAERFSQAAIKQAVSDSGEELHEGLLSEEPRIQTLSQSLQAGSPIEGVPRTLEMAEFRPEKRSQKAEPLFVRIDRFESAMNNFDEIRKKIVEIERALKDIKEVRSKEEEEFAGWEREVEAIKARLDTIDKNIFEKVE